MTEAEWLASVYPARMLRFAVTEAGATTRKVRLYACACCRLRWHQLGDDRTRAAVTVMEAYADGNATLDDVRAAHLAIPSSRGGQDPQHGGESSMAVFSTTSPREAGMTVTEYRSRIEELAWLLAWPGLALGARFDRDRYNKDASGFDYWIEERSLCDALREVVGNPFRPPAIVPAHLTPAVTGLARTIYDDRAFDRMHELAGALEGAGCADADVLAHCRGPGPHVRGCWVLDLLLGRA